MKVWLVICSIFAIVGARQILLGFFEMLYEWISRIDQSRLTVYAEKMFLSFK